MIPHYPNKKPAVRSKPIVIDIEFATPEPVVIGIRHRTKPSLMGSNMPLPPRASGAFSEIAFSLHWPSPPPVLKAALTAVKAHLAPLTERMPDPERLIHILRPDLLQKNRAVTGNPDQIKEVRKPSQSSLTGLKQTEFNLKATWANSVKLAGDFTDWEKYPLDMNKAGNGVWSIIVWLSPGQYSYRFIVDSEWYDDPHSTQRVTNPFGSTNMVIQII